MHSACDNLKEKNLSYNVAHSSTRAYKCWMCERACVWRCITSMYNYSGILLHLQTVTMFDMCVSISMPCHTIPSILLYSVDIHCFFSLSYSMRTFLITDIYAANKVFCKVKCLLASFRPTKRIVERERAWARRKSASMDKQPTLKTWSTDTEQRPASIAWS